MLAAHLPPEPAAIAFWTPQRGLLAIGGRVEVTRDGGRSFRLALRAGTQVDGLQTDGPGVAIASLADGSARRTLDGGRTWHPFGVEQRVQAFPSSPCPRQVSDGQLTAKPTPQLGWVVCLGGASAGQQERALYRTRDGGHTWHTLQRPHGAGGYPAALSVAADGFGLLDEERGTLLLTHDGGVRWHAARLVAEPEVDFGIATAAFTRGRGLFLVRGELGVLLWATADGGRSWELRNRWRR